MKIARAQAGFVLQVALGAIVILVIVGSFLYARTEEHLQTVTAVRLQQIAGSRAIRGAEMAIANLKTSSPAALSTLTPCPLTTLVDNCPSILYATLDNGLGGDLSTGAGQQYQVNLVVRTNAANLQPRLVVVSTGYYGYVGSPNQISAQVQVELSMPSDSGGSSSTGYAGGS